MLKPRIRLAASTSPVDVAWAAFDSAAIRFNRMYGNADALHDTDEDRGRRMRAAEDVARLWNEWRKLFLSEGVGAA